MFNEKVFVLKSVIIISMLFNCLILFAQNDTINKTNSKGKKEGYWMKYLDGNFNSVDSISKACYFLFDFYYNGKSKFNAFNNILSAPLIKMPLNQSCKQGYPIALKGVYVFADKINSKGLIDSLHMVETKYDHGHLLYLKEIFYSPQYKTPLVLIWLHLDIMYNHMQGSSMNEVYRTNSKKGFFLDSRSFYYKENGHWRRHKIKSESKE
jgi:hypothetical protein